MSFFLLQLLYFSGLNTSFGSLLLYFFVEALSLFVSSVFIIVEPFLSRLWHLSFGI